MRLLNLFKRVRAVKSLKVYRAKTEAAIKNLFVQDEGCQDQYQKTQRSGSVETG